MKLFFIIALICTQALADPGVVNIVEDDFDGKKLGRSTYWYRGDVDIGTVSSREFQNKFIRGESPWLNFGADQSVYWYRLDLLNPDPEPQLLYFLEQSNLVNLIELYIDGKLKGSLSKNDVLYDRTVNFVIQGEKTTRVFIKMQSDFSGTMRWTLWKDPLQMTRVVKNKVVGTLAVVMILIMSLLFNVMLYYAYRSKVYLYYIFYLVAVGILIVFGSGTSWLTTISQLASPLTLLGLVASTLFGLEFLGLKKGYPRLYLVALALVVSQSWSIPLSYFLGHNSSTLFMSFFGFTSTTFMFFTGMYVYAKGKGAHVLIFVFAHGIYNASGLWQALIWTGYLPQVSDEIIPWGVIIENLLMLLALGKRVFETNANKNAYLADRSRLEKLNSNIRIKTLTDQMQPHFLFNSLVFISHLVDSSPKLARESIEKLSDLYRRILLGSKTYTWPLAEELAVIEDYLSLQKLRFAERLQYELNCDGPLPETIDCPCLMIHTLIENSIKHAIAKSVHGGKIVLDLTTSAGGYRVKVTDSAPDVRRRVGSTGTGLTNTRERLAVMYGDQSDFKFAQNDEGTVVEFWISGKPVESMEAG